jgi:hypothetical protein
VDTVPWLILAAIVLTFLLIPIPKGMRNPEKLKKYKKRPTSGAFLGVVQEMFQPGAANASIVVEEQKESRKATPSADDKQNKKPAE